MGTREGRVPLYYRIIRGETPSRDDFLTGKESGQHRPTREDMIRLWETGFSVLDSEERARSMATAYPRRLGGHIAEMVIEDGSGITVERTTRTPGHHTMRGDPDAILARVRRVVPV